MSVSSSCPSLASHVSRSSSSQLSGTTSVSATAAALMSRPSTAQLFNDSASRLKTIASRAQLTSTTPKNIEIIRMPAQHSLVPRPPSSVVVVPVSASSGGLNSVLRAPHVVPKNGLVTSGTSSTATATATATATVTATMTTLASAAALEPTFPSLSLSRSPMQVSAPGSPNQLAQQPQAPMQVDLQEAPTSKQQVFDFLQRSSDLIDNKLEKFNHYLNTLLFAGATGGGLAVKQKNGNILFRTQPTCETLSSRRRLNRLRRYNELIGASCASGSSSSSSCASTSLSRKQPDRKDSDSSLKSQGDQVTSSSSSSSSNSSCVNKMQRNTLNDCEIEAAAEAAATKAASIHVELPARDAAAHVEQRAESDASVEAFEVKSEQSSLEQHKYEQKLQQQQHRLLDDEASLSGQSCVSMDEIIIETVQTDRRFIMPVLKIDSEHRMNTIAVLLTWNLINKTTNRMIELNDECLKSIKGYEVYGIKESASSPGQSFDQNNPAWILIGSIKPYNPPIKCTLTDFLQGSFYYFTIKIRFENNESSDFCQIAKIRL